ncbi:hypothetical protein GMD78_08420 [Ornithinibacillus sp. L9]|uniref:Uncharacterized protein n=1 Tax=Ornithinibacillus caprae TaxID=2678566 RepID=A0A6N8FFZ0_9BACI|nr:hypothetical protein [Ornithinibacillus caprae]MUK88413.1 hypothetical protein [Ornithinibacillus caprae]
MLRGLHKYIQIDTKEGKHYGGDYLNLIANQDKVGTSKLDLYLMKTLYILSFKRSKWLKKQIIQITKDLEAIKSRNVH